MIEQNIPEKMGGTIAGMTATCGAAFRQMPEELARITAFVEAEMKGQNLPNAPSNRDEFIATTFARMYPLVLSSDECRQAVENMMKKSGVGDGSALKLQEGNPQYAIGPERAHAMYMTGNAVMGAILLVTAGETERPLTTDKGVQYDPIN